MQDLAHKIIPDVIPQSEILRTDFYLTELNTDTQLQKLGIRLTLTSGTYVGEIIELNAEARAKLAQTLQALAI